MVTLTPGSTAPLSSTVVHMSLPVVVWDHVGADTMTIVANKNIPGYLMTPPIRSALPGPVRRVASP